MKNFYRIILASIFLAACISSRAQKGVDLESELPPDAHHLKIGDAAPDFSLKGVDGKMYSLVDFSNAPVLMVAFSPDGATLAACGGQYRSSGEVKLFEVASGKVRASFDGHKEWVECVRFAPGGEVLVSSGGFTQGRPGEVRAWSVWGAPGKQPERLTAQRMRLLWDRLAGPDAAEAYQALREISAAPDDAVPFLKRSLRPIEPPDPKAAAKLIDDLDNG